MKGIQQHFDEIRGKELLEKGWTVARAAKMLGVSYASLYRAARIKGWNTSPNKPRLLTPDIWATLKDFRDRGASAQRLSRLRGCSREAISYALRYLGYDLSIDLIDIEEVLRRLEMGMTGVAIAKELGFAQSAICHRLVDAGVRSRRGRPFEVDADKVLELRKAGRTFGEIAKELGCSMSAAHRATKRISTNDEHEQ